MFSYHKIKIINGEECLCLYLDNYYEFSKDLTNSKNKIKKRSLKTKIKKYIKDHNINFKGNKVNIIVNGFIILTVFLGSSFFYQLNDYRDNYKESNHQYVESMNKFLSSENDQQIEINNKKVNSENIKIEDNNTVQEESNINENNTVQENSNINKNNIVTSSKKEVVNNVTNEAVTTEQSSQQQTIPSTPPPVEEVGMKISLVRASGTISISLEDYVIGVVGAEMPASFNVEALKSQAVVARTYALKRIAENKTITDTNTNQMYKDNNQLKAVWGSSYDTYYNKIKSAVNATKGEYVAYNGYYIDALYHSTSNGKTEDPINVWGGSFPYLKSVDSHWDTSASTYERTQTVSIETFSSTLGIPFNIDTPIEVISKTTGDRINQIKIGDNTYLGIDIRDLFDLRSADFDITISGDNIIFTTRGYGHGVGMSQYGANGMAKEGYSYRDILSHYYPNTNIKSID